MVALCMWARALCLLWLTESTCRVGYKIPHYELDLGFPPQKIDVAELIAGKNVVLVGLPGAFTPT